MTGIGPNKELNNQPSIERTNLLLVMGLVTILATLIVPLPTFILDLMLACSISLAISVLIITLASKEALDLSTFPTLLLFVTLFRLSLNVASTRLILLNGDAGKIISTFGDFVAGGSFVVGLVIFLILVIIQFIVITKGSERISEVSARFTLDAMPGKQMAIDADLNAGAITEQQANERRTKVVKESEFYGAMDGASKFIRGDAIAGLIITAVNIIGGIVLGYSNGMSVGEAVRTYSILSIGDGLVAQIPSIIISVSSGFLVTKISSQSSVSQDLSKQFLKTSAPLLTASVVIAGMALIPGMPKIPFLALATIAFVISRKMRKVEVQENTELPGETKEKQTEKEPVENLLDIDRVSVNVGVRLIGMVDPRKNSTIFDRIGALRRTFAQQLGIIIPLVRLRDNITIDPNCYEIKIFDHAIAKGRLEPDMFLAMDSGTVQNKIDGIKTTEPVYGLPALWIGEDQKESAEISGYTVIDPESVFITHLSETLKKHAAELLTREDTQQLVERLRQNQPSLVGEVVGDLVPIGLLQRVLKNLLADGLPVKQLTTILESLGESASKTKNPVALTELVRKALARTITQQQKSDNSKVYAITFEPSLEHQLISSLVQEGESLNMAMPSEITMEINRRILESWKKAMDMGIEKTVLLCDSRLRNTLAGLISRTVPHLPVIAYNEIVYGTEIEQIDLITINEESMQNNQMELSQV